jgi:hypothetical protein
VEIVEHTWGPCVHVAWPACFGEVPQNFNTVSAGSGTHLGSLRACGVARLLWCSATELQGQ